MSCDFLMLEPAKAPSQENVKSPPPFFPVPLLGLLNTPQSALCQSMFLSAEWGDQHSKQRLGLS